MNVINKHFLNSVKKIYPKPTIIFSSDLDLSEPVVFVANHEKNYGPCVMQLFFPIEYRPWIINRMLEPDVCSEYIRSEFFEARLNISAPFSTWISKFIEPMLIKVMHSTRPIPVYRQDPRHITQTFNQSIDALLAGENLLVFPENGEVEPYSSQVRQFFNGFIYLTKLYYRKTKKRLSFVPVAINPRQHTICVGKAIRYQPESNYQQEQYRICQNLLRQIDALYKVPWPAPRKVFAFDSVRESSHQAALPQ